jgi:hypothetical protein
MIMLLLWFAVLDVPVVNLVVPSLGSWVPDRGSVVIAAPTAPDRGMYLDLFTGLRVLDQLAEVDHALIAGETVVLCLLVLVLVAA